MSNNTGLSIDELEQQLALPLPARELMQTLTVTATVTVSVEGVDAPDAP